MSSRVIDRVGQRFGRLVILERAYPPAGKYNWPYKMWKCACDCGTVLDIIESNMVRGGTKSCGCYRADSARIAHTTHGETDTRTFRSWQSMLNRCNLKKHEAYHNYGGRGIVVCDSWKDSYENFLKDMGDRPEGMSLDRIDTNGNYEPTNCRWATTRQQRRNTRNSVYINIFDVKVLLIEASEFFGVSYRKMHYYWEKYGNDSICGTLKKLCGGDYEVKANAFRESYIKHQSEGEV